MPLYFFDIAEPNGSFKDDIGTELTDFKAVREACLRTICEIAAETHWQPDPPNYGITVRDAEDREIYAVSLNLVEHGKLAASGLSQAGRPFREQSGDDLRQR